MGYRSIYCSLSELLLLLLILVYLFIDNFIVNILHDPNISLFVGIVFIKLNT